MTIQLNPVFSSSIGVIEAKQFLNVASDVSDHYIHEALKKYKMDPTYPLIQSGNMVWDKNLVDFNNFILSTANDLLDKQGYDVTKVKLSINDMWCQKHFKMSNHERHVHNNGAVLTAFYMLECPANSCHLLFYDPRVGKEYGFVLPEKDERALTDASNIVNYGPSEGELIMTNAYIPHGFTRNASDKPFTFLHINIYAEWVEQKLDTKVNTFSNKAIVV